MFVYFLRTRRPDPRGACTASMALSCKLEKGGSAGQIRGFDPRVSPKQLASHYGLTREVTRISRVMTRPDPRDFENLLTRPDPIREILKPCDPTRPDPRDFENLLTRPDPTREILKRDDSTRPDPRGLETLLTRPAGRVMTREKPWLFGTAADSPRLPHVRSYQLPAAGSTRLLCRATLPYQTTPAHDWLPCDFSGNVQIPPYLLSLQPTFRSGVYTANSNEVNALRLQIPRPQHRAGVPTAVLPP